MGSPTAYKLTGMVVLVVGILFFLRDNGLNLIGDISGWSILIILIGAAILSTAPGKIRSMSKNSEKKKK